MAKGKAKAKAGVKPEVLAAIAAALAMFGPPTEKGAQVTSVTKSKNPWRKAGIVEIMLGRELNKDFL